MLVVHRLPLVVQRGIPDLNHNTWDELLSVIFFWEWCKPISHPCEHIPPGSVTSMLTKSTNSLVCQSFNWRLHGCVGQVRVSVPREGLCSSRHPGHPAVQTQRVRQPDQPEHGERLGNPPLRHRHLPQAGRGQVPDPQGPQQGERRCFCSCFVPQGFIKTSCFRSRCEILS